MKFLKSFNYEKWQESSQGKSFKERIEKSIEEYKIKEEELYANADPDKLIQAKLFKIIIVPVFIIYCIAVFVGYKFYKIPFVFLGMTVITCICLLLFYKPPKFIKYKNCFLMPVFAFIMTIFMTIFIAQTNRDFKRLFLIKEKTQTSNVSFQTKEEFDNYGYTQWLKENKIQSEFELNQDYNKMRESNER